MMKSTQLQITKINIFKKIWHFFKNKISRNIIEDKNNDKFPDTNLLNMKNDKNDFFEKIEIISQKEIEELDKKLESDITGICFISKKKLLELQKFYDKKIAYMKKLSTNK